MIEALKLTFVRNRADVIGVSCLLALITAIFGLAIRLNILLFDYPFHIQLARDMASSKTILLPHFLYHLLTIGVHAPVSCKQFTVLGVPVTCSSESSFYLAAFAVTLFSYLSLGVVIYAFLCRESADRASPKAALAYVAITLGLMLVSPIHVLTFASRNIYLGYVGINVYHNPTIILLKPLALLLFWCASKAFSSSRNSSLLIAASATLTVSATLAKPNYTICLLPALAILSIYHIWNHKVFDWRLLILGILIPALIVLGWQYDVTYNGPIVRYASSVVFAPFKVTGHYKIFPTRGYLGLFVGFGLSILFPVCVAGLYWKLVSHDTKLLLAWLAFLVGAFYSYFLAESGARVFDGNFLWSGQITLFILFVASTWLLMRQTHPSRGSTWSLQEGMGRLHFCGGVFGLHLISGLMWYVVSLLGNRGREWWGF